MTLRRLHVLIKALGPDAHLWVALSVAEEKANRPAIDKLRERQAYYDERAREAEDL